MQLVLFIVSITVIWSAMLFSFFQVGGGFAVPAWSCMLSSALLLLWVR